MRTETVAIVALLLGISAPAAAQESVTLSRYRLSVLVDGGETDALPVDLTEFTDRCGDVDGCELTLRLAAGFSFDPSIQFASGAKQTRLYLGTSGTWTTDSAVGGDANGTVQNILDFVATTECVFSDGEFPGNQDLAAGFWLKAIAPASGNTWVCTLTVID